MYRNCECRKFIITLEGNLVYGGLCEHQEYMHASLIPEGQPYCYGGGYVYFFPFERLVVFIGASFDYGPPQWERWKWFLEARKSWKYVYKANFDSEEIVLDTSHVEMMED